VGLPTSRDVDGPTATFYYDLGSPECYLVAERVSAVLPLAPQWEPVLGSRLAARTAARGFPGLGPESDRTAFERVAADRGLQPIRWPTRWPPDSGLAMRAAGYAKSIGRVTAFSLAAFRQAFAAGRDLDDPDTVVIAAAACEMHPTAVLGALRLTSVQRALEEATERAVAAGVRRLPALTVGDAVYEGDGGLDVAAEALLAAT
jgi:2-hydroxychromene-2-carboxylate isomerase